MKNREGFAILGNVTSKNSFGTNYPIKSAGALLELEMRELVRQLPGKCFVRKL